MTSRRQSRHREQASIGGAERELAEHIAGGSTNSWITAAIGVAGALSYIALCRMLTARHQRLTGEVVGY